MNEKVIAGLVATTVITPICAACILGPAAFASVFAGLLGWFGGLVSLETMGLAVIVGIFVIGNSKRTGRLGRGTAQGVLPAVTKQAPPSGIYHAN